MNIHEKYIFRCIELAKNGLGTSYPNPLVGSVIVLNDKIIGEGWHRKAGEPHAEVNAINSVRDRSLLKKATLYVNLEPCSHFGKTPPCANFIVENGIRNVVIGVIDTNSNVNGKGVAHLKNNNCNVIVGVLQDSCLKLNKRFFTFHSKKRPFIILKWAETEDGFIDSMRDKDSNRTPNWISNKYSQQLVHKMRATEEAILVGTTTVLNDNPSLNIRSWQGINPVRIVLDRALKIPADYSIMGGMKKTILLTEKISLKDPGENIQLVKIDFKKDVPEQICDVLYQQEIQSLIIEGGAKTLQSFIDKNLWDEAYVFVGNRLYENGLKAPRIQNAPTKIQLIAKDTLNIYSNKL